MKRNLVLSAVSVLLLGATTLSASTYQYPSFLPPNGMRIPVGSPQSRGMNEAEYNKVLDAIQRVYAPIVAKHGGVLQINRLWTDDTVNASAQQSGNKFILNMYGGLARHADITMDGLSLVACHELGHHLGGAPKSSGWSNGWASIEGEADYYATLKCLRFIFADPGARSFTQPRDDDQVAIKDCDAAFSSPDDRGICIRGAKAGKSVTALFMDLHHEATEPHFDTPDTDVVAQMYEDHPATQCRLDTYLQGALCAQPASAPLSDTDPTAGACTRGGGFTTGLRPLCWYKPAGSNEFSAHGNAAGTPTAGPAFSALRGPAW